MILVTGANGLLGSHLCAHLLMQGKEIVALKRENSNTKNTNEIFGFYDQAKLYEKINWETGDIMDVFSLEEIILKWKIKEIYHCAALVSFEPKDHELMYQINVQGTANMVNVALENGIEKFCHVSSIASIPSDGKKEIIDEKMVWKSSPQHTMYAVTKYGAEREVWRAAEEGLNVVIVNPSMIIGPGCWNQSSAVLFSNSKKGIRFYTPGGTGVVDVRDVANSMIALMEKSVFNERFILSGENLSFREILSEPHLSFGKSLPSVEINKFTFRIGYRLERIMCVFNGKKPRLSKDFIKSGFEIAKYDNSKVRKELNFNFVPFKNSVKWACSLYPEK